MTPCLKDCPYAGYCRVNIELNVDCTSCRSYYEPGHDKACSYCGVMFPSKRACWFLPVRNKESKLHVDIAMEDTRVGESQNGLTRSMRQALAIRIRSEYRRGGTTQNKLADKYFTTQSIVSKIIRGQTKYYSGSLKSVLT